MLPHSAYPKHFVLDYYYCIAAAQDPARDFVQNANIAIQVTCTFMLHYVKYSRPKQIITATVSTPCVLVLKAHLQHFLFLTSIQCIVCVDLVLVPVSLPNGEGESGTQLHLESHYRLQLARVLIEGDIATGHCVGFRL